MIFKCKMCGGDIEPIKNTNTGKCLYCKSVMTLPNLDDEKIINLYNRANDLRLSNEFDKAYGVYETILEIDNKQVEAHWGLLLCKYGIEYVDDPKTKKKIPTCHRTIADTIFEETDYKYITKNSYGEALEIYEKEAKEINKIQKDILKISNKEEPYDIFICYKETDDKGERTRESVIAEDIYEDLVKEGYKVFFSRITLEDKLGEEFEPYIYSALKTSKLMLVIGTKEENFNAVWVKNEWSRYLEFMKKDKSKYLIPVYSKIDVYNLPENFSMLQAQNMDKVGAKQDLIRGIKKLINLNEKNKTDKKEISDVMYERLQKMLEEDEEKKKEAERIRPVETLILKETPVRWYAIITFIISLLIIILFSNFKVRLVNTTAPITDYLAFDLKEIFSIQYFVILITIIAFFLGVINKKTQKISKYMYLASIILEIVFSILVLSRRLSLPYNFCIGVILNLGLILIIPKWNIKKTILKLPKEEAVKYEKKNIEIKKNFNSENNIKFYKPLKIVSFVLTAIAGILMIIPAKNKSYYTNDNKPLIEVSKNYAYIYSEPSENSKKKFSVFKGELFSVHSWEKGQGICENWYKIKINKDEYGYACINDFYVYYRN